MPGNFANTQDLVEVQEIKQATVVMKNGSLRQVVMVGGVNFSLKSEEEQNLITQAYQNFLNSLSFPIQIVIHSRKINIERYLGTLEGRRAQETSGLLQDQISEYSEFIRQFVRDNEVMAKTFLIIISYFPVNLSAPTKQSLLNYLPFRKKTAGADLAEKKAGIETFQENLLQIAQRTNQVADGLAQIGLEAKLLEEEELVELFYNFYNPETVEREDVRTAQS